MIIYKNVENLDLSRAVGFDWDEGNISKSQHKHQVHHQEAEQVFFNQPQVFHDKSHSQKEARFLAYGETDQGRKLTIVFTIRKNQIRVISARNQSRRERQTHNRR